MTFDEYQEQALRTAAPTADLANCALGLCGKSGEFADIVKKHVYHGHGLDPSDGAKELGDVLWYLTVAAKKLGFSLEYIASLNIAKLRKRYPDGFSTDRSVNR